MQDQEDVLNEAEAATQALRDGVSRARQMASDVKRALEMRQEPDADGEGSE
jgi:hypothetical protein